MPPIENLNVALNDMRGAVAACVERIRQLAHDLALARAAAAEAALIEQIATELRATAEHLRAAVSSDPAPPA